MSTEPDHLHPIPTDNQPGHHPDREQDKPDLDAFARRLGLAPDGGAEPTGMSAPDASAPGESAPAPAEAARRGTSPVEPAAGASSRLAPVRRLTDLSARRPRLVAPPGLPPAPASPVDPAALVGEVIDLGVKVTAAVALFPLRFTIASVRAAWSMVSGGAGSSHRR